MYHEYPNMNIYCNLHMLKYFALNFVIKFFCLKFYNFFFGMLVRFEAQMLEIVMQSWIEKKNLVKKFAFLSMVVIKGKRSAS